MKRVLKIATLFVMGLSAGWLSAQTTCSTTEPCVQLTIGNANSLPSTAILLSCMGSASTTCTPQSLASFTAQQTLATPCPAVQSAWKCVAFTETKTPQLYNDLEPWGSLMNYAVEGTNGEGVSAASPILIFQVPALAQAPTLTGPQVVTVGTVGPQ